MALLSCHGALGRYANYVLFSIGLLLVILFTYYYQASFRNIGSSFHLQKELNRTSDGPQPRAKLLQAEARSDIIVLIWVWPYGAKGELTCEEFGIHGCRLTDDQSMYRQAHGVAFHHQNINGDLSNMPTEPRPWFQKWAWFNMESPTHSVVLPGINDLFNLTCNYRKDSDVKMRYWWMTQRASEVDSFQLPVKNKTVCWAVSNWNDNHARVKYYNEFKKHIHVDGYGAGFGNRIDEEQLAEIVSGCKFYLAFENSQHRDYISWKFFNPLKFGAVPVALGPPRSNYEEHAPADSFIHVDDFPSPKELAERLLYLDQNPAEYMKYFEWNKRFTVTRWVYQQEYACRICSYLQVNKGYEVVRGLNSWFWV